MKTNPVKAIVLDPEPPEGVEVFYYDKAGRPCRPSEATHFTFSGAPQWWRMKEPEEPK